MDMQIIVVVLTRLLEEMDEDDEFSDDSDETLPAFFSTSENKRNSIKNFWEETASFYVDKEFKEVFRVSRAVFNIILGEFVKSAVWLSMDRDKCISSDKQLGLFLYFAGHEACSSRSLRDRFDVSLSTVHSVIVRMSYFLSGLSEKYIVWPDARSKVETSDFFANKTGFSKVFACLDGTHIRFEPPKHKVADYMNRKKTTSIQMQGICNHRKQFIDVFIGFPGRVHDARVFRNSDIFTNIDDLCEGK